MMGVKTILTVLLSALALGWGLEANTIRLYNRDKSISNFPISEIDSVLFGAGKLQFSKAGLVFFFREVTDIDSVVMLNTPISGNCVNGVFTDARDGKTYRCAAIGSRIWMLENLNFGRFTGGSSYQYDASFTDAQKYCFKDDKANCTSEGALYQWHTAMAFKQICDSKTLSNCSASISSPHRGICPKGWHIPSEADWNQLEADADNLDGIPGNNSEGVALKATTAWTPAGADLLKFSALPAGTLDNGMGIATWPGHGITASWWVAAESPSFANTTALKRSLGHDNDDLSKFTAAGKTAGLSIRCIQD